MEIAITSDQIDLWQSQLINENAVESLPSVNVPSYVINHNIYECPKCYQNSLDVHEGILICQNCHSDYGSLIDDAPEWKYFGSDDNRCSDPTRCGNPVHPILVESSYGTTFWYSQNSSVNRLKNINKWHSMPHHERSLKEVFDRLTHDASRHGLTSNIIELSHRLFAEIITYQSNTEDEKLSRADPREGLISACLFYACQEYDASRSPHEIAIICEVSEKTVTRGINLAFELLKNSQLINVTQYVTRYSDFLERYCNKLGLNQKITQEIRKFANLVNDKKILTKCTPQAMMCGCIYFIIYMRQIKISKTEISNKCGPSVPTITKAYERLLPHIQELI